MPITTPAKKPTKTPPTTPSKKPSKKPTKPPTSTPMMLPTTSPPPSLVAMLRLPMAKTMTSHTTSPSPFLKLPTKFQAASSTSPMTLMTTSPTTYPPRDRAHSCWKFLFHVGAVRRILSLFAIRFTMALPFSKPTTFPMTSPSVF